MMTAVFATCSDSMISKLDTTNIALIFNIYFFFYFFICIDQNLFQISISGQKWSRIRKKKTLNSGNERFCFKKLRIFLKIFLLIIRDNKYILVFSPKILNINLNSKLVEIIRLFPKSRKIFFEIKKKYFCCLFSL